MMARAVRWLLSVMVMGMAACDGGGGGGDSRTAFVEVTSTPSGLAVVIQLNNTRLNATTPVAQHVRYDTLCIPTSLVSSECQVVGSADVRNARGVTLCVTEGGKRACESETDEFVILVLDFEP